jgi:hypothetical protein
MMRIKANERVLLAGQTGSGKTYFAELALSTIARLVVIDTKASLTGWKLVAATKKAWGRLERGDPCRLRVVPPIEGDQAAWFDALFMRLYEIGSLTLYIDEAYGVVPPGARAGAWLNALYTRGRERGIGVWACTQRPMWIPLFLISEANWLVVFRLNLDDDRKRMASMAGEAVLAKIPDPHGFWLYHVGDEAPSYFSTIVLK